jgi:hypothetical protein
MKSVVGGDEIGKALQLSVDATIRSQQPGESIEERGRGVCGAFERNCPLLSTPALNRGGFTAMRSSS